MTDITLKAEEHSAMEAIYVEPSRWVCVAMYLLAMERVCVINSCHSSWAINMVETQRH